MPNRAATDAEFHDFYQAHWSRLVAALSLAVPQEVDPEDVAQEAFTRAFSRWRTVAAHPSPEGWLFLTAFRVSHGLRRRLDVRRKKMAPQSEAVDETAFTGSLLAEILGSLPPRQRAVLILRHYYGFTTAETASAMDCPEGTVKSLLSRARKAAAEDLSKEGHNYA